MSTVFGGGPEFCSAECNLQWSDYGTALLRLHYDVVMQIVEVEFSCDMYIDLQAGMYGTEIGNEV